MSEFKVTRTRSDAPSETADFFDEVKNGRDETTEVPGGYGSYPHIHVVETPRGVFYGFSSGLDESREPWAIGYRDDDSATAGVWVERDTVLDAESLEPVEGAEKDLVNTLIEASE